MSSLSCVLNLVSLKKKTYNTPLTLSNQLSKFDRVNNNYSHSIQRMQ